jgi:hypothetical protein
LYVDCRTLVGNFAFGYGPLTLDFRIRYAGETYNEKILLSIASIDPFSTSDV